MATEASSSGMFWTAAKFNPSWNAPVLVAPSPMYAIATRSRGRAPSAFRPLAMSSRRGSPRCRQRMMASLAR